MDMIRLRCAYLRSSPWSAQNTNPPSSSDGSVTVARRRWRALFALVRPAQWPKNLLAVPLVLLTKPALSPSALDRLVWITALFILSSALTYIFNDLHDRDRDRVHPSKRLRPIASGEVSTTQALLLGCLLSAVLVALTLHGPWWLAWPVGIYLLLNFAYSRGLKHVALLELLIVSSGFVLRFIAGCTAVGTAISGWLTLTVMAGSMLLVLGKRRHELLLSRSGTHRPVLAAYSVQFLEQLMLLSAGLVVITAIMFLSGYSSPDYGQIEMVLSAPFVLLLAFRYLQLTFVHGDGAEPTRLLLHDRMIICTASLCLLVLFCAHVVKTADLRLLAEGWR